MFIGRSNVPTRTEIEIIKNVTLDFMELKPINSYVAVMDIEADEKVTESGIIIKESDDHKAYFGLRATVVAVDEKLEDGPKVGDKIVYNKYDGIPYQNGADKYQFIKNDMVVAILSSE